MPSPTIATVGGYTIDESETIEPIDPVRLDWVRKQLAGVKYKNWTFTLEQVQADLEPLVMIRFDTTDSTKPGKPFTAEAAYRVEVLPTTEEAFGFWALAAVASAEMHEVAEMLTVGGKQVIDPHSPQYRQWDGAIYYRICDTAAANANPFHEVLYAGGAEMVAANAVPPEIALPVQCREHLQQAVAPRRVRPRTVMPNTGV